MNRNEMQTHRTAQTTVAHIAALTAFKLAQTFLGRIEREIQLIRFRVKRGVECVQHSDWGESS